MKLNEVSSDRIDELKAAAAMAATKKAGSVAAKGAKVAGQAAMAATKKAAGAVASGAKKVVDKGMDKAAGALANQAMAMGGTQADVATAQKELGKQGGLAGKVANSKLGNNMAKRVSAKMDPKADSAKTAAAQKMQQQKAGMGAKLAGGKNAQKFTRGVQDLEGGKAIRADLAQELKPHITNLQNILANPQLRVKWLQLVKQANQSVGK